MRSRWRGPSDRIGTQDQGKWVGAGADEPVDSLSAERVGSVEREMTHGVNPRFATV